MSFNIRYDNPNDGPNRWANRREMLFGVIEAADCDLIGLQEVLPSQAAELKERFGKTYAFLGVPREDGKTRGEIALIMYRRDRFDARRDGTFWLSETPDQVGSKGWDAALARVVTWVELIDRRAGDRPLVYFNTHWDHQGKRAREGSAKLMRQKITELASDRPVVITGDFNADARSRPSPYRTLLGETLFDTFADVHPAPTTQDFTFHGFKGQGTERIDWILHNAAFRTREATIVRTHNDEGRYPSDHFPVTATLQWSPK